MTELSEKLGSRIRYFRTVARMSQGELAQAARLTNGYLSDVERGKVNISISNVQQIAKALNVPLSVLVDFDSESRREATLAVLREKLLDLPEDVLVSLYRIVMALGGDKKF